MFREKSVTCSGFVIGTAFSAASTVAKVEVQLDGGTWENATGTTSWIFKLPTGGNTWRDGTAHTIQVRATDSYNEMTSVTISVRKGLNQDINGDGYADLVVGAPYYSGDRGRVYIYHSTGIGGITATTAVPATKTITGSSGYYIGSNVKMGDINGDGYADVVIGSPEADSSRGRIDIYHSTGSTGINLVTTTITTGAFPPALGSSIAVGDINGDGYADIAGNEGVCDRVVVFYSSGPSGITITQTINASLKIVFPDKPSRVLIGDVNGDGCADLAVSVSYYINAYIFHSTGTNGITATDPASANVCITGANGLIIGALGDINGDGYGGSHFT